ncbi:MAG: hypothetical protein AABW51_05115 [Nanoarchaeota archaeon]
MTTGAVDLSRRLKDTELFIVDLKAKDSVRYESRIEKLTGFYHRLIERLRACGIN